MPIGLHFGWNFAEGSIFGTDVSGTSTPEGLLHGLMSGPTALSGGGFGPEASVYAVVAGAVVLTLVFMWMARRRGHIVPRRRRAAGDTTSTASTVAP